ncbi:hypothetical protein KP509_29G056400 [Ceratopteris richardii]|uniref:Uncharacterized protein n=1 Tax=Ceratopteris richardii TaxID=49495 RepID=A0A8T2R9K6_CERRI|nr:hypothetical protein KP509_29G056400 [Ceratopteris richardii]
MDAVEDLRLKFTCNRFRAWETSDLTQAEELLEEDIWEAMPNLCSFAAHDNKLDDDGDLHCSNGLLETNCRNHYGPELLQVRRSPPMMIPRPEHRKHAKRAEYEFSEGTDVVLSSDEVHDGIYCSDSGSKRQITECGEQSSEGALTMHGKKATQHRASRIGRRRFISFSVVEGRGRTLKGRDLTNLRNRVWQSIGFLD